MNFSDFAHTYQSFRAAFSLGDKRTTKKALKELEQVIKQIEKSRVMFTSGQNAMEGIAMYEQMAHLGEEMMKPMMMVKYTQKAEMMRTMLQNGMIEGGAPSSAPDAQGTVNVQGFGNIGRIERNPNYQSFESQFDQAIDLADKGFYYSAITQMEEMERKSVANPFQNVVVNYNLGAICFTKLGKGKRAKQIFEGCVRAFDGSPSLAQQGMPMHAAALENLMLLSLDFDEYQKWANELRIVAPDSAILSGQFPAVKEKVEVEGWAWWQSMFAIAMSYYNRNDPAKDPGLYGNAASVFDLVIENRRSLRLPREEMRTALYEYNALIIKIVSENIKTEENAGRPLRPEEYLFMLEQGRNTIDAYKDITEGDANIAHERQTYTMYIDALTQ
ncbi:hypothetical protein LJC56_00575 [Christensenellaceae bacterium OttesenSCG-928-K19]|nr:hypothetical protein [Christensenellaceae bacterium OttesenSCG-928-K19]